MADFLPLLETTKEKTRSIDICGVFRPIGLRRIAAGFCPRGAPRSSPDSNSIKAPFICRGGPSNRLGRAREAQKASRFAQQLRGPTFAGSCMDSPSVPTPPLPPPPPPPPVHTCSCLQQMFEEVNLPSFPPPPASSSSHKPKKKNKKRHTKASPGCPQDSQARRVGGRIQRRRTEEGKVGRQRGRMRRRGRW